MKLLKIFLIVLAIGLFPIIACDTDELVELNENPNAVQDMDWRYVMSNAQNWCAENRYVNWRIGILTTPLLMQQLTSSSINTMDKYFRGNIDYPTSLWDRTYTGGLKETAECIRKTAPGTDGELMTNTHNVARILYNQQVLWLVDYYGNVPYYDANRGIEGSDFFLPRYDAQQDIYTREGIAEGEVRGGLLWELDDAAAGLASPGIDDISDADMMHGGDLGKWRKTAFSWMLREAMRINEVDPGTAKKYIDKAIAGGLMTSNDDNQWIQMATGPSSWLNQNGFSRGMYPGDGDSHNGYRLTDTFIDFMKGNNDPRLMILSGGVGTWDDCIAGLPACDKDPANQLGRPNGWDNGDDDPAVGPGMGIEWWCANDPDCSAKWDGVSAIDNDLFWSCVNPNLLDLDEPHVFMTYAEVELLLAEIAERGIATTPKTAAQHYADGIRAAIHRWVIHDASFAVTDAAIDAYLLEPNIAYTPGAAGLEQIAWQYWAATFMSSNNRETYANWRRTGRPTLVQHDYPNNISNGKIFRRFIYDPQDLAINEANYKAGGLQPNDEMTRMWWDMGYDGVGNQTN